MNVQHTEKMALSDFMELCQEEDYNIVKEWSTDHFKIVCQKCKSDDTILFFRDESGQMGSEYTGYMEGFNNQDGIIVKCKNCGNAMNVDNLPT